MDRAKRASMREGPLAQLFRRTDEDAPQQPAQPEPHEERPAPEPATTPEARAETRVSEQPAERPLTPEEQRAARREAERRSPIEGLEDLRPAPPSQRQGGLAPPSPAPPMSAEPRPTPSPTTPHREPGVRGPKQRLEEVFATDIPDNMLERAGATTSTAAATAASPTPCRPSRSPCSSRCCAWSASAAPA
jgi:hypothetical protein